MQITMAELAELVGGELRGDGQLAISDVATIRNAQPGQLTFAESEQHLSELAESAAAAVVISASLPMPDLPAIVVADVTQAVVALVTRFRPPTASSGQGIHPSAFVAESAQLGRDVIVEPHASIGEHVRLGDRCHIHSGARIMPGCRLGDDVTVFPNAVLYPDTVVGQRVLIHANAVVGSYGFGYKMENGRHQRCAQLGHVELHDDVEVGAGTTIDRGTYDATLVGAGSKLDNQIQIGHNSRIGRHNLICAQVGIAGSCSSGDYVVMAGQVGMGDHLQIGDRAVLGAKAGVMNDIPAGEVWIGAPACRDREFWKQQIVIRRLPELQKQLKQLRRAADASAAPDTPSPTADAA